MDEFHNRAHRLWKVAVTQILHNPTVQHTHHGARFMATDRPCDPEIKREVEMKMSGLVDLGKVWGLV